MHTKDEDHTLLSANAIGYMLKVIKSGKNIAKFKDEFNAIKHGDYDNFLEYIREPQPFMVQWASGVIKTDNFSKRSGDCDFTMILLSGPSISTFMNMCFAEYGPIADVDISDMVFCRCAAYEISLRNHYNNQKMLQNIPWVKIDLVDIVDELCQIKNISQNDKDILQDGRKFINMIKGHKKHFDNWQDGVNAFKMAWEVRNKYGFQLV